MQKDGIITQTVSILHWFRAQLLGSALTCCTYATFTSLDASEKLFMSNILRISGRDDIFQL